MAKRTETGTLADDLCADDVVRRNGGHRHILQNLQHHSRMPTLHAHQNCLGCCKWWYSQSRAVKLKYKLQWFFILRHQP